jgi:hypothetical protein
VNDSVTDDARDAAQSAAEFFWHIAASKDRMISRFDSPVYEAAKANFLAIVRAVYDLSTLQAEKVYEALTFYGPHEMLTGTRGNGVRSYVQFVDKYPHERMF